MIIYVLMLYVLQDTFSIHELKKKRRHNISTIQLLNRCRIDSTVIHRIGNMLEPLRIGNMLEHTHTHTRVCVKLIYDFKLMLNCC